MGAGGGIWETADVITFARMNQKTLIVQAAEPAVMYAGMLWLDTDDDNLYQRKNANDGWYTITKEELAYTITGLWTFNRGAAAPFAVDAASLKVTNLDADKVDGKHIPGTIANIITDHNTAAHPLSVMPRAADGLVLTSTGVGSDPAYEALPTWTLLTTLNPAGVATIDTGAIAAHDLWMVLMDVYITDLGVFAARILGIRFNDDAGNNYDYREIDGIGINQVSNRNEMGIMELHRNAAQRKGVATLYFSGKPATGHKTIAISIKSASAVYNERTTLNGTWDNTAGQNITKMTFFIPADTFSGVIKIYYMDY